MDNVIDFPTPRERAGISTEEDMDRLIDSLTTAMLILKHSDILSEEDREEDLNTLVPLAVKYFIRAGYILHPEEEE